MWKGGLMRDDKDGMQLTARAGKGRRCGAVEYSTTGTKRGLGFARGDAGEPGCEYA